MQLACVLRTVENIRRALCAAILPLPYVSLGQDIEVYLGFAVHCVWLFGRSINTVAKVFCGMTT